MPCLRRWNEKKQAKSKIITLLAGLAGARLGTEMPFFKGVKHIQRVGGALGSEGAHTMRDLAVAQG